MGCPNFSGQRFSAFVLEVVAATTGQGGAAARLETCELLPPGDTWGFPKYPSKTVILPPEADLATELRRFVERNGAYLSESDCFLGTWINPHTGYCYLDITTHCDDLDRARQVARTLSAEQGRNIVALYNAKLEQTVYLWDDVRS